MIQGIVEFRQKALPGYRETFAKLALGQAPNALFIACSDSRVAVNVFASTNPGDLFVVRNVGNMIPPADEKGISTADESEAAALEFALGRLEVHDIIVCGHSECGAIGALVEGREKIASPNLRAWLRHGEDSLLEDRSPLLVEGPGERHNRISQRNVLTQMDHLRTYPTVQRQISERKLNLHGWWFELKTASVYAYENEARRFVLIDEAKAEKMLHTLQQDNL